MTGTDDQTKDAKAQAANTNAHQLDLTEQQVCDTVRTMAEALRRLPCPNAVAAEQLHDIASQLDEVVEAHCSVSKAKKKDDKASA